MLSVEDATVEKKREDRFRVEPSGCLGCCILIMGVVFGVWDARKMSGVDVPSMWRGIDATSWIFSFLQWVLGLSFFRLPSPTRKPRWRLVKNVASPASSSTYVCRFELRDERMIWWKVSCKPSMKLPFTTYSSVTRLHRSALTQRNCAWI